MRWTALRNPIICYVTSSVRAPEQQEALRCSQRGKKAQLKDYYLMWRSLTRRNNEITDIERGISSFGMFPCNFWINTKIFMGDRKKNSKRKRSGAPEKKHKLNNRFSWEFLWHHPGLRDETVGFYDVTLMTEIGDERIFGWDIPPV